MPVEDLIAQIGPLDEAAMAAARARQDMLTKPPGSLGRLEALSIQLAGITGNPPRQAQLFGRRSGKTFQYVLPHGMPDLTPRITTWPVGASCATAPSIHGHPGSPPRTYGQPLFRGY